jgi:hypothetical protein
MIHTILIDTSVEPEALKKEFRKKLMTGGAVVRLPADLSDTGKNEIFATFAPHARPNNVCSMVLIELAKSSPSFELAERLGATGFPQVQRALNRSQAFNR